MVRALNNIGIRTLGVAVSGLLVITAIIIILASRMTVEEVGNIGHTWKSFNTESAAKADALGRLHNALGYGGMIHQFKNYVLRRNSMQFVAVQNKMFDITAALLTYPNLGVNLREKNALAEIHGMVLRYADNLIMAENMVRAGATSQQIDKAIMIDDGPAIAALRLLDNELQMARTMSANNVYRSVSVVKELANAADFIVTVLLGLLIVSFLWFTHSRLVKPLTRLGNAMEALAAGDSGVTIPDQDRNDEIGAMARSV